MPPLRRDDIITSRLSLMAITPEMLLSDKNGDGRLGELIQCVIPGNVQLSSVIAHSFPSLPASIRVMERCGMVFDGAASCTFC
jgi:hypothetical protein